MKKIMIGICIFLSLIPASTRSAESLRKLSCAAAEWYENLSQEQTILAGLMAGSFCALGIYTIYHKISMYQTERKLKESLIHVNEIAVRYTSYAQSFNEPISLQELEALLQSSPKAASLFMSVEIDRIQLESLRTFLMDIFSSTSYPLEMRQSARNACNKTDSLINTLDNIHASTHAHLDYLELIAGIHAIKKECVEELALDKNHLDTKMVLTQAKIYFLHEKYRYQKYALRLKKYIDSIKNLLKQNTTTQKSTIYTEAKNIIDQLECLLKILVASEEYDEQMQEIRYVDMLQKQAAAQERIFHELEEIKAQLQSYKIYTVYY